MAAAAIEKKVRYDIGFLSQISRIITPLSARKSEQNSSHPTFPRAPQCFLGGDEATEVAAEAVSRSVELIGPTRTVKAVEAGRNKAARAALSFEGAGNGSRTAPLYMKAIQGRGRLGLFNF
jgi:hypothetical protein